jgi:hypothetical protein
VYYTTNLGKIMADPSIPGLGKSLSNPDPYQGLAYQAKNINLFEGTDLDKFLKTDFSFSTGSEAIDNYTPMEIGTDSKGGFFSDPKQMAGFGSLITAGAGLANTLAMMPILQEQRRSLEQNRKFAAEDQLARRTARNGFNSFRG